jgi:(p)ppGpp synthase/HD superfamily hydrolase
MIAKAIKLAAEVHDGQVDKGGAPYIFHVLTVMRMAGERTNNLRFQAPNFRQDVMVVAVLHDVIEDFKGTQAEKVQLISFIGQLFGNTVMHALLAMTHRAGEAYEDYIERVAENAISTIVKICDLTHNMDPRRMPDRDITQKDFERWNKYRKALVRLEREE